MFFLRIIRGNHRVSSADKTILGCFSGYSLTMQIFPWITNKVSVLNVLPVINIPLYSMPHCPVLSVLNTPLFTTSLCSIPPCAQYPPTPPQNAHVLTRCCALAAFIALPAATWILGWTKCLAPSSSPDPLGSSGNMYQRWVPWAAD